MLAEANGLAKGIEEYFAVRTIAEVRANFFADLAGQLIVQIGRETFEDFEAIPFPMPLMRGGLAGAWICAYAISHGGASS